MGPAAAASGAALGGSEARRWRRRRGRCSRRSSAGGRAAAEAEQRRRRLRRRQQLSGLTPSSSRCSCRWCSTCRRRRRSSSPGPRATPASGRTPPLLLSHLTPPLPSSSRGLRITDKHFLYFEAAQLLFLGGLGRTWLPALAGVAAGAAVRFDAAGLASLRFPRPAVGGRGEDAGAPCWAGPPSRSASCCHLPRTLPLLLREEGRGRRLRAGRREASAAAAAAAGSGWGGSSGSCGRRRGRALCDFRLPARIDGVFRA